MANGFASSRKTATRGCNSTAKCRRNSTASKELEKEARRETRAAQWTMVPDGVRGVVGGGGWDVVRERSEAWWSNWVKKERLGSGRRPCAAGSGRVNVPSPVMLRLVMTAYYF